MSSISYVDSFQLKNPDRIVVERYTKMSDKRDEVPGASQREISDKTKIAEIVGLLNQLPDEGDMMVKMGDVALVKVSFVYPGIDGVYFEFYNNRIKTPATSFYGNESDVEKKLFSLLVG
jgi:hypothetical protein